MAPSADRFSGQVDPAWLSRHQEPVLDPDQPIVDPHHHLWSREGNVYWLPELLDDLNAGHNVIATVFEECHAMYRETGPLEERSLGETESIAALAIGAPRQACARIVGNVDLMTGDRATSLLERHIAVARNRFAGVRYSTAWDEDPRIHNVAAAPGLLGDASFRAGFAALGPLGLVFDAWVYHPQLPEVAALAAAFPATPIVLNHCGSPILGGARGNDRAAVFTEWTAHMTALSRHPNVSVKLGALPILGRTSPDPPSSREVAEAWRPWLDTCITMFGAERCMFESNFPVQKRWCSYTVVWNAFKRIAAGASADEKCALFAGTAARVYGVPV